MKNFKFWVIALVAILGLNSCSEDCNHEFIEHDYSQALVGTWTCMEGDYAEAMVIKADGSVEVTGVVDHEFFQSKGTIKVVNNKMIYKLDNGDEWEGRFEMITGESFTMVWDDELDIRYTYRYCENDLADEIVGMWVSNDGPTDMENEIQIRTYGKDGKVITTGVRTIDGNSESILNEALNYKVVGDLVFKELAENIADKLGVTHNVERLIYTPNATALGDLMNVLFNLPVGDYFMESRTSFLRVKQNLDLTGKAYDYNNTYVSNVKGLDEDMTMMGYTFNIGKMEGKNLDKMLKTLLFAVEFPNANTIKYQYHYNGQTLVFEAPIVVDGNKVSIKMSALSSYYRDVDMYMYQDKDNTQLHMYMPTYAFINYFANMDLAALTVTGDIDLTDAAAVETIFERMDERVESINVSFTFKASK